MKPRIDKTQQNSKCMLCGDSDETMNHISECSKLVLKEYKTTHEWVGKMGDVQKFKFYHTNKLYMHHPAPVLENDWHKLILDFDKHTDHLISSRRPYLIIITPPKKKEFAKLSTLLSQLTKE